MTLNYEQESTIVIVLIKVDICRSKLEVLTLDNSGIALNEEALCGKVTNCGVMESNRDEADKCLELAMKYVRQGNKEKAERFVRKAEKLFPSRRIQEVLNLVEQMGLGEEEKSEGGSRGERERSAEQSHDNEEASTSSLPKNFTQEQV